MFYSHQVCGICHHFIIESHLIYLIHLGFLIRIFICKNGVDISVYSACVLHTKSLQSCPTLYNSMDCSLPGSSIHGDSLGKNTGVGCHALLQGIFPTQGLSPALVDGFFSLAPPIYMCIYVHDSKGSFPLRQKFQSLLLVTILVCLACYNKILLTEWFKHQKLFSQFWRLEIQNQGSMV